MWTISYVSSSMWMLSLAIVSALGIMKPDFDNKVVNITVKEKNTAVLPCSVINLGNFEMVWTDQYSTLLTYQDRRIIDDDRLSVERPYPREWNLHIRDVRYSDQGVYNCQINTDPVRIKVVYLQVLVPSQIVDRISTSNVTIREGDKVTLVCNATGFPIPRVTWFRIVKTEKEEVEQSELCAGTERVGVVGEVLVIHNVTRYCGGTYKCVAFNDVKPAAYRKMDVSVSFPPEVYLPNERLGQAPGKDTILECIVSAHPISDAWWEKDGVKISNEEHKYRVEIYDQSTDKLTLSVRIYNLQISDFGTYICHASNRLGSDNQEMTLHDYNRDLRTTTTTTTLPATTSFYYIQGRYNNHHNIGDSYQSGHHQDKKEQQQGYNVHGQGYDDQGEGRGRDYSQGRGYGGRPGSLTGNQGSEHIYTPTYRHGNTGSVQPAQAQGNDKGDSSHVSPCWILLMVAGSMASASVTKPSLHLL